LTAARTAHELGAKVLSLWATMPIASLCIDAGCVLNDDGGRKWTTRSNIQVVFPDPEFAFPRKAGTKSFPLQRKVVTSANCA
jgi:hypothetical protein